jgi:hypothetical protein
MRTAAIYYGQEMTKFASKKEALRTTTYGVAGAPPSDIKGVG